MALSSNVALQLNLTRCDVDLGSYSPVQTMDVFLFHWPAMSAQLSGNSRGG